MQVARRRAVRCIPRLPRSSDEAKPLPRPFAYFCEPTGFLFLFVSFFGLAFAFYLVFIEL